MNPIRAKFPYLPPRVGGLAELATNLGWSWSRDARGIFRSIDRLLWQQTRHNPILMLQRADRERLDACAADPGFLERYDALVSWAAHERTAEGAWFTQTFPDLAGLTVAYFCAEFGFHASVPIYSGGLGVLAGDHCKTASDLGVPLVGVGLLYRRGYFDQRLRLDGWQEDGDERLDPTTTPLVQLFAADGAPHLATVRTFGRTVHIGAWQMMVGRVPIYLLDTDLDANDPLDRDLTGRLYGEGLDLRLRQEWVLGVGGVRVLRALGVAPSVWHANEGHASFMMVERMRELVAGGTPVADAIGTVRAASVFTTHTPVPAGHDTFDLEQVERCTGPVWEDLGLERSQFFGLGRHHAVDQDRFHMTVLAIRLSRWVNGVSRRHGEESRRIWQGLWPGRRAEDVPIGHVTNGVHLATWMAQPIMYLLDRVLGTDWGLRLDRSDFWEEVLSLDAAQLWEAHRQLKGALLSLIREETRRRWADHWKEATHVVGAGTLLDPQAFTIGFARRFATYKRADLLFRDPERLRRLLVDDRRPVQIIFAGKAHPADDPGKGVLQHIYQYTRDPRFEGRVAFVEGYDHHIAHRLVQGVDLWLNLPRVPLEACGTSGMKAALNGVPQAGTLDGWWAEGHTGDNGWAIPEAPADADVDAWDAEQIYRLLEEDIVPLYYERDSRHVPLGWVDVMRRAIRAAGLQFTGSRMVRQYVEAYYAPAMREPTSEDEPPLA